MIEYILNQGASILDDDQYGNTACYYAVHSGIVSRVKLLNKSNQSNFIRSLNMRNRSGQDPMDIAIKKEDSAMIEYLKRWVCRPRASREALKTKSAEVALFSKVIEPHYEIKRSHAGLSDSKEDADSVQLSIEEKYNPEAERRIALWSYDKREPEDSNVSRPTLVLPEGYVFTLNRPNAKLLEIECTQNTGKASKVVETLKELKGHLQRYLEFRAIKVDLEEDEEKDILRVSGEDAMAVSQAASLLREVTGEPLERFRVHSFFKWPKPDEETVEEVGEKIECAVQ